MTNEQAFHWIFAVTLVGVLTIQFMNTRLGVHHMETSPRYEEGEVSLILRGVLLMNYLAAMMVYILMPEYLDVTTIIVADGMRWMGALMAVVSVPLLWWIQRSYGDQFLFTLDIYEAKQLARKGPYRWVRHPLYLNGLLFSVGVILLTSNWAVGGPLLLGLILMIPWRVRQEERAMLAQFGDEYRAYMRQTGRFFPKFD